MASVTAPEQRRSAYLTRLDLFRELPRQDAAAVDRQVPAPRRLRHGANKNLLFDGGKIQPVRQDSPNGIGMQRAGADAIAGADAAKQRSGFELGHRLPGLEGAHRTGFREFAAWQADLGPLPCLVGLAAANAQPQPAAHHGDVLDAKESQFGATERVGEAEQQQRPITAAALVLVAGRQQLPEHGERQRRGLAARCGG